MMKLWLLFSACIATCCLLVACSKSKSDSTEGSQSSDGSLSISFVTGAAESPMSPPYAPPPVAVTLSPAESSSINGFDPLEGTIELGSPERPLRFRFVVARSQAGAAYDRFVSDRNGDGRFEDMVDDAEVNTSDKKTVSTFNTFFLVKYPGDTDMNDRYAVTLWLTTERAGDTPAAANFTRQGFREAKLNIDGNPVFVMLSDANNDACFGEGDWWEVFVSGGKPRNRDIRLVGEFAWIEDKAYVLTIQSVSGRQAHLKPIDPGMSQEEDLLARNPIEADKSAVRAEKPLAFRHDIEAALREASQANEPVFIKFETSWCGPCKLMSENVFTSKDVVEAAGSLRCVAIDGDQHKDLIKKFRVTSYPTGILLGPSGEELARCVGYQSVKGMSDWFRKKLGSR